MYQAVPKSKDPAPGVQQPRRSSITTRRKPDKDLSWISELNRVLGSRPQGTFCTLGSNGSDKKMPETMQGCRVKPAMLEIMK